MKAYLSPDAVLGILKIARESSTRDWCMFLLTFRHALRSQEARQLRVSDVDLDSLTITVARVKGSRSGVQSLDRHKGEPTLDEVVALKAWLKERVEDGSQVLFPSQKGGMMTRMQFLRLFRKYAQAAGVSADLDHPHAWQVAQQRARDMEATGISEGGMPLTVEEALRKFLADAVSRNLRKSTLRKHELMQRNLTAFCQNRGLVFLRQLDVDQLREFRNTWKLNPRTAAKTLERLRSFVNFCLESDWIEKNPAKAIKTGKVDDAEVLPFNDQEIKKILAACERFNGDGKRIKTLTQLMLVTGLRIGDASTISRDKFVQDGKDWKLELRTAKTGVKVYVPLQEMIVQAIESLPGEYPFWTGESTLESCTSVWQEAYRKLFKQAGISGHPHRFRHTFAKNLLVNEVPMETVSLLLGHRKLAITEKHYARFVPERQALIERQIRKTWAHIGHTQK